NVQRHGWLVLYLFGASPAFCASFFAERKPLAAKFAELDPQTLYKPAATSLRMSDIGYRNDNQAGLNISFDTLDEYVASLVQAINTEAPAYQAIGVNVDGEYRQLSANILQIANEYYSPVRPKQIARSCESPTLALKRRGVRYIELRSLDLNPACPLGLELRHMRFLELFLLCCLLRESPPLSALEKSEAKDNALAVASRGREPGLRLSRQGQSLRLDEWAMELAEDLLALAAVFDAGTPAHDYRDCVAPLLEAIANPGSTPSAQILAALRDNRESFQAHTLKLSRQHAAGFRARPLDGAQADEFSRHAEASQAAQRQTEADDSLSFDAFLKHYFTECSGSAAELAAKPAA
ncbi:MAG: glutamate--cysteine ligase, partial [Candidatus Methylumidiphilus sp.]